MTTFSNSDEFEGTSFVRTSFRNATFRSCDVSGVTMRAVDTNGLEIDDHDLFFGSLVVNGVDVVPLVDAELNRLFPSGLQSARTPEGLREGYVAVHAAEETVASTPVGLVDTQVEVKVWPRRSATSSSPPTRGWAAASRSATSRSTRSA